MSKLELTFTEEAHALRPDYESFLLNIVLLSGVREVNSPDISRRAILNVAPNRIDQVTEKIKQMTRGLVTIKLLDEK